MFICRGTERERERVFFEVLVFGVSSQAPPCEDLSLLWEADLGGLGWCVHVDVYMCS